ERSEWDFSTASLGITDGIRYFTKWGATMNTNHNLFAATVVAIKWLPAALGGITAVVAAVYALGTQVIDVQRIFPDLYYGLAAESCLNAGDYPIALRAGNMPLVRCLLEK